MSYTKGEWKFKKTIKGFDDTTSYLIGTDDFGTIAELTKESKLVDLANAQLIAAAPELLEACKKALEHCYDPFDDDIEEHVSNPSRNLLIQAINKAKGN